MLKINEIFFSIQGESTWAGTPTLFIRTSGCHLRCHYCDTTYAYHKGQKMTPEELMTKVKESSAKYICITGGEPLLQKNIYPFSKNLCDQNYKVSIETSGDIHCEKLDPRVKKIIDIKTPDSGEDGKFHKGNLDYKKDGATEYKFVICSEKDFHWAEKFTQENQLALGNAVLYSPSHGEIAPKWLAEKMLEHKSPARLQLQMHKYIWPEESHGV